MTYQLPREPMPPAPEVRLLRRSRADRIAGGVCGGLGRYLGVNPVLLRIAAVALALSGGAGILAYIIAWIAIPEAAPGTEPEPVEPVATTTATVLIGGFMLVLGVALLLRQVFSWFDLGVIWPLLLLAAGILVMVSGVKGRRSS